MNDPPPEDTWADLIKFFEKNFIGYWRGADLDLDSTNNDNNVRHRFSGPKASAILKQFSNYISNIISGELHFSPEEMDYITKCPNESCSRL